MNKPDNDTCQKIDQVGTDKTKFAENDVYRQSAACILDGFFVKPIGEYMRIKLRYSEIIWVEAENNYSHIHRAKGYVSVSFNIQHVMEILPKNIFMRINRSEIVNMYRVSKYYGNTIYLEDCTKPFVVGKSFREQVFRCFYELKK